jgi:hypothetical protein
VWCANNRFFRFLQQSGSLDRCYHNCTSCQGQLIALQIDANMPIPASLPNFTQCPLNSCRSFGQAGSRFAIVPVAGRRHFWLNYNTAEKVDRRDLDTNYVAHDAWLSTVLGEVQQFNCLAVWFTGGLALVRRRCPRISQISTQLEHDLETYVAIRWCVCRITTPGASKVTYDAVYFLFRNLIFREPRCYSDMRERPIAELQKYGCDRIASQ